MIDFKEQMDEIAVVRQEQQELLSFLRGLPYQDEEDLKERISNFLADRFVREIVPLYVDIDYNPTNRSVNIDGVYFVYTKDKKNGIEGNG